MPLALSQLPSTELPVLSMYTVLQPMHVYVVGTGWDPESCMRLQDKAHQMPRLRRSELDHIER